MARKTDNSENSVNFALQELMGMEDERQAKEEEERKRKEEEQRRINEINSRTQGAFAKSGSGSGGTGSRYRQRDIR